MPPDRRACEKGARVVGVTCETCGLVTETPSLRCPRCGSALPLGCGGSCRGCGLHRHGQGPSENDPAPADGAAEPTPTGVGR